jgi:hypothetical protein
LVHPTPKLACWTGLKSEEKKVVVQRKTGAADWSRWDTAEEEVGRDRPRRQLGRRLRL